jgi:group I intron endonuclease
MYEVNMKKCGIYKITNTKNNFYYIGSSVDITSRFCNHRSSLRKNSHNNPKLQNAWNKYGEHCFSFEIVELCDPTKLYRIEQKHLNKIKGCSKTYNIVFIVGGFPDSAGHKNPRWINVSHNKKKIIKQYWRKHHTVKTIQFMKDEFGYGGSIARRVIKEIKDELNMPNRMKDNTIYHFKNLKTGESFKGTRQHFIKQYDICCTTVSELVVAKTLQTRSGWIISQSSKT